MTKTTAILLMAGVGSRFKSSLPKQFHRLAGKKIYQHTLHTFLTSASFTEILLVCPPDRIEEIKLENKDLPVRVIAGGSTRQESSYLGLLACAQDTAIVVIHDAARPFVTHAILQENIAKVKQYGAVNTCIPSTDTLVHAPDLFLHSIPKRSEFLRGQTPQSFYYPLIVQAHAHALQKGISDRSDDCSLVLDIDHPVHIVLGSEQNIKITTELDLYLADQLFRLTQITLPHANNTLVGKKYIVTGGTGGIGKALCALLAQEGALPIPISRSSPLYPTDLTHYSSVRALFDTIQRDMGPIDGLINSVGLLKRGSLTQLTEMEIADQLAVNLTALIFCCQLAPLKQGAHIVNIASSSYARGRSELTIYSSTKAAVVNFTQGLAEERPDLCVNAIVPKRTHTPLRSANFPNEEIASLFTPQEVAQEIVTLLKHNLTGSIIEVKRN